MAKPSSDDIDIDAGLKQVDSRAMSKGVWEQAIVLFSQSAAFQRGCVPSYDFVDTESCERLPLL